MKHIKSWFKDHPGMFTGYSLAMIAVGFAICAISIAVN